MQTACFRNAGKDPHAVSIARSVPTAYQGKRYAPLAPLTELRPTNAGFDAQYNAQLANLDPAQVYAELLELAGPDALLICNERPGDPCHRRLAANWLATALGIEIPESDRPWPQLYLAICSNMDLGHPERYDEAKNVRLREVDHMEGSRVILKPESEESGIW